MISPLPHQLRPITEHVRQLRAHASSFDGSDAGVGKTFVACFVAKALDHPIGVLCPKAVIAHWRDAAGKVGVPVRFISNREQFKAGNLEHLGRWKIRGRTWTWNVPRPTLLVFDECHLEKTRTSQNAKLMIAAARQRIPTLALSATAAQSPLDMFALGFLVGLHQGVDFLGWCCTRGVTRGRFSWEFTGGPRSLVQLHQELYARGVRVTTSEIPGFPDTLLEAFPVDIDPVGAAELGDAWTEVQRLEALEAEALTAVTARLRARQKAEILKVPAFEELAKGALDAGRSVVLFLNFKETIAQLAGRLGARTITGDVGLSDRNEAIAGFQGGALRALVCQCSAGGVGISLHDTVGDRPRETLISPPESARDLIQILGRVRRTGGRSTSFQKIVCAAGTVEDRVRRRVEAKVHDISLINDQDLNPLFT